MRRALLGLLLLATALAWAEPAAWRVTAGAGGEAAGELVLLGSIHYLREQDYPLPARVDELYRQADVLVLELGPEDLDPARVQAALLGAAMLPPGHSLEAVLGEELYARAVERARELGVDIAVLAPFQPWMVALTLTDLGQARHGFRGDLGLEQHLLRQAVADDKEVSGLEALETQIAVFDGLSDAEQRALLEQALAELEELGESMRTLASAWREGRLDALAEELLAEFRGFPELYDALVTQRNSDWVIRLEELLMDERHHLVVVGALHLVGPENVVELLEARGWHTSPID